MPNVNADGLVSAVEQVTASHRTPLAGIGLLSNRRIPPPFHVSKPSPKTCVSTNCRMRWGSNTALPHCPQCAPTAARGRRYCAPHRLIYIYMCVCVLFSSAPHRRVRAHSRSHVMPPTIEVRYNYLTQTAWHIVIGRLEIMCCASIRNTAGVLGLPARLHRQRSRPMHRGAQED